MKKVGQAALGIVLTLAILVIPWVLLGGLAAVAEKVLPWLNLASTIALGVCLLVLAPLAVFRRTRTAAGIGLYLLSYVFGLTAWITGLLVTWTLWGGFAVVVGIALFGIGVVFTGALAAIFSGLWSVLGWLSLAAGLTYGARLIGFRLASGSDSEKLGTGSGADEFAD